MERLDKLVNIQILDLSDNLIKKIEGIENLQQLTVLNLEDNQIESLPAFIGKKLKCLRTFKIARNQLHSVSKHSLFCDLCVCYYCLFSIFLELAWQDF